MATDLVRAVEGVSVRYAAMLAIEAQLDVLRDFADGLESKPESDKRAAAVRWTREEITRLESQLERLKGAA